VTSIDEPAPAQQQPPAAGAAHRVSLSQLPMAVARPSPIPDGDRLSRGQYHGLSRRDFGLGAALADAGWPAWTVFG